MPGRPRLWLGWGLIALGLAALSSWAWAVRERSVFEARVARGLVPVVGHEEARSRLAAWSEDRDALAGRVIGFIEIPRLGLDELIVHGTEESQLQWGVGHVAGTALPGEDGNVCLAGHRDTHFGKLERIAVGDRIRLHTPDADPLYEVDSILIVRPDRTDLLEETAEPTLTLVTCYPFYWIGPAGERFVVRATRVR